MKILKLILIFAVVVGGLFLALNWSKVMSSISGGEETEEEELSEVCKGIRADWGKQENWNEDLYLSQKKDMDQEYALGVYEDDEDAYFTAQNCLRETATNIVYNAIFREFHSTDCHDNLVKSNYAGVAVLKEHENGKLDNDHRIKQIVRVKALYDKIESFCKSPHTITARYDANNNTWTSFSTLSSNIINTASSYRNNSDYKADLSEIKRFKDGLNDSHIRSVVNGQEAKFYRDLSNQIIRHFGAISNPEEADLARLNNAFDKYGRETSQNLTEMAKAVREFTKKYNEQHDS